ncbi:Choline-sulfatase (EC [Lentimonas sp. CC19]|nr:Choline-sulfatase (EC [Lentimonas sp. CC10]CAA6691083.1 Choline-sulfatase (EC [Lentimonas sp. CC19]CAA7069303.1 Choline-sulfatase (EC [Lentimonas sp. CC11]
MSRFSNLEGTFLPRNSIVKYLNKMKIKKLLPVLAFVISVPVLPVQAEQSAVSPPNILFIFADDWGWGDLSCHGHPYVKTPNIDRLAKEGTDFQNFTVASGVCSPSRTAVMTGLFPARLSVTGHFATPGNNAKRGMPDWVDPELPMLPRILQEAGYMTGHFGKWHLSNNMIPDSPRPEVYGYDMVGAFNCSGEQMPVHDDAKNAIVLIEKSVAAQKPFFINLWVHEPHTPFHTLPEYRERFPDLEPGHNVYASVLSHADDRIGEVLDTLDRLGLTQNTLVIFSSDNGPAGEGSKAGKLTVKNDSATGKGFGHGASVGTTGGRKGRKGTIYQGGIGIPFLVRWPGEVTAGAVDDTSWISAVDLLPTFCEIAGAPLPDSFEPDGVSQIAVLKGTPALVRKKPLFWKKQEARASDADFAILDRKWKLLTDVNFKKIQLYDISVDPLEQDDVSQQNPEVAAELLKKVKAWNADLPTKPDPELFSEKRPKKYQEN